jgi:hypothetical protein
MVTYEANCAELQHVISYERSHTAACRRQSRRRAKLLQMKLDPDSSGVANSVTESREMSGAVSKNIPNQPCRFTIVAPDSNNSAVFEEDTSQSMDFIRSIYALCRSEETEEDAIDFAYQHLSLMLKQAEIDVCDNVLASIDVRRVTAATIASMLTITAAAKSVLEKRSDFYNRAEAYFNSVRGIPATSRLLVGLA